MQTIGERLEEARKKKGISIREAAEATKIRGDYLQKFESNHFDIGLTEIYTRGFLRTYANFLKIPSDRIINDYAALGRGEARPRQPAREVYGRMDISVATSEGNSGGNPPTETPPEKSPAGQSSAHQPHYPKTGSSLPTGPDPAIIFKYLKWGGGGVIVILSLLLVWSLVSGPRSGSSNPSAITNAPSRSAVFGLEAIGPVRVTVHRANPDGTDGDVLFSRTLTAGEKHSVPRPGPVFIEASLAQNLQIVLNGRPHNLGDLLGMGSRRGELPAP